LFTRKRLPGWIFVSYLVFQGVPDWEGRLDFWLDAAKTAGGHTAEAAVVIASRYFSIAMAGIGIVWLALAGEPRRAVLRDPRWIYLGWGMVAVLVAVLAVTLINGYVELRTREAISAAPLKVTARRLDDPTKSCLKREAPTMSELENRRIVVGAINGDREGMQYASDFLEVFGDLGLLNEQLNPKGDEGTRFATPLNSNDPTMHGVLLGVPHKESPPNRALVLQSVLLRCEIASRFVSAVDSENKTFEVDPENETVG
jgi:hypothetical protein